MTPNPASAAPLELPDRVLRTLSYCEPNPKHLSDWIENLPMVNLGEASKQLYHAIIELNQLIIDPETRFNMLELLRTPINFVCRALSKHYMNQPIALPEKARKIARLAAALDNQLAIGYKIVLNDKGQLSASIFNRKYKKVSAIAVHRAITTLSHSILRSCALYTPAPLQAWYELNQLFLVAETNDLLSIPIEDRNNHFMSKNTIADAYKRILMLACCSPNKLRQLDLLSIYDATELWSRHVNITAGNTDTTFVINLATDAPPIYRDLARKKMTPFYRGLEFQKLIDLLQDYLSKSQETQEGQVLNKVLTVPDGVSANLVGYLAQAWQSLTERSFSRIPSSKHLHISLGFSGTHYHVSGGIEFETQLQGGKPKQEPKHEPVFAARPANEAANGDAWADAFDAEKVNTAGNGPVSYVWKNGNFKANETASAEPEVEEIVIGKPSQQLYNAQPNFPLFETRLVDTSPNGYQIVWKGPIPKDVRTGELVGVSENEGFQWSLGTIRWVRQESNEETYIGVQLIAANALPCGARIITEKGKRCEYMRCLFIPAMEAMNQPASLVAPKMPFKTGSEVFINQYGETQKGRLIQQVEETGCFNQFVFQPELDFNIEDQSEEDDDFWPDI